MDAKLISVVDYGLKRMKIGQLAVQSGVHVETIRYYQSLGLMPRPPRARGSVRRYGEDAAIRLRFIKRAQALGFSLDEVKLLLRLSVGEHCAETRSLAKEKAGLVEKKIADLRAMQGALNKLIRACARGAGGSGCPIIEDLCSE
jgi:MerR family mercuric resistance operon transcriptional regulator